MMVRGGYYFVDIVSMLCNSVRNKETGFTKRVIYSMQQSLILRNLD